MKKTILILTLAVAFFVAMMLFSLGIAYSGGVRGLGLVGVMFFFTAGIFVILAQLVPACILVFSAIKAFPAKKDRDAIPVSDTRRPFKWMWWLHAYQREA